MSVVVPTYNRPRKLAECLQALAAQEYSKEAFEIIVVDDGGEVDLRPLLGWAAPAQVRLCRQDNRGPGAARNLGVIKARMSFIAFTDDDCIPEAGWLRALTRRLQERPEEMVGGRVVNGLTENRFSHASQALVDRIYIHCNSDPAGARLFATNNMALARDDFHVVGGFDERFRTAEDRDFCDRWIQSGRCMFFEEAAVVEHRHEMGFRGFVRQHFEYGRGAYLYHRDRSTLAEPSFRLRAYWKKLSGAMFPKDRGYSLQLSALLGLSQLASLTGYCTEWLRPAYEEGVPSRRSDVRD